MRPVLPEKFLRVPLAHRALHDRLDHRPENSRAAVRAAVDLGYGIEIDVQLSADGQAMVFHDYDLGRLTEAGGPLRLRTADALAAIGLRGGREGIPTLSEILGLVGGVVPLLVEIKDQDGALGPAVGPLERAVAADLAGYDGAVAVMSFNPHSIRVMAEAAPEIPRGLTTCAFDEAEWGLVPSARRDELCAIPDFEALGCAFISHDARDLSRARVAELKAQSVPVLCWTVRSQKQEDAARAVADNVTFEGYAAVVPGA